MHATCLHCSRSLGANAVLETLPIGRRIAFDPAQGRLWVVCRGCARWNLVPFDTRLETIDAAERLYRDTTTRYATDNIGLARLAEGLELVRIGPARRHEFAAWRYGDAFGKRTRRAILQTAAGTALTAGIYLGGPTLGAGVGLVVSWNLLRVAQLYGRAIARVPQPDGPPLALSYFQLGSVTLTREDDDGWVLTTRTLRSFGRRGAWGVPLGPERSFRGAAARPVLSAILARANALDGSAQRVREAVALVEDLGTFDRLMAERPGASARRWLVELPKPYRLAVEMALHEENERTALAGELRLLEWQWREADRLARIADGLALE